MFSRGRRLRNQLRRFAVTSISIFMAASIILTMSAGLVHRAMHAQSATRAFFDGERSALRLSEQFRADVHQAATATVEAPARNDGVFLRLRLAGDQAIESDLPPVSARQVCGSLNHPVK